MFLGKKNLQLVQGLNKSYIELLDLYVHSRLGLESKFLLKQNNPVVYLRPPLFYKVKWTAPKCHFML